MMTTQTIDLNMNDDRVMLASVKPIYYKEHGIDFGVAKIVYRSNIALNFKRRVKMISKKNFQIEYKFKRDDKTRVVLQSGKLLVDTYLLDYGYPYS